MGMECNSEQKVLGMGRSGRQQIVLDEDLVQVILQLSAVWPHLDVDHPS